MKLYQYTVIGHGYFPLDMLRYDSAYPRRQIDVDSLTGLNEGRAIVDLSSHRQPTVERWNSFGWDVKKGKPINV